MLALALVLVLALTLALALALALAQESRLMVGLVLLKVCPVKRCVEHVRALVEVEPEVASERQQWQPHPP